MGDDDTPDDRVPAERGATPGTDTPSGEAGAGTAPAREGGTSDTVAVEPPRAAGGGENSAPTKPAPTRLEPVDVWTAAGKAPGRADIEKQREDVREFLAKWLLGLLAGTMLVGAAMMVTRRWTHISGDDTRLFFQVGFSAIIALVSAATGFYFGNSAGSGTSGSGDS